MSAHEPGATVALEIKSRYVEERDDPPNSIIYAPDTDRMKSSYSKYIFNKEAYLAAMKSTDTSGTLNITITAVNSSMYNGAPGCPEPMGGFHNKYFTCTINSAEPNEEGVEEES